MIPEGYEGGMYGRCYGAVDEAACIIGTRHELERMLVGASDECLQSSGG